MLLTVAAKSKQVEAHNQVCHNNNNSVIDPQLIEGNGIVLQRLHTDIFWRLTQGILKQYAKYLFLKFRRNHLFTEICILEDKKKPAVSQSKFGQASTTKARANSKKLLQMWKRWNV